MPTIETNEADKQTIEVEDGAAEKPAPDPIPSVDDLTEAGFRKEEIAAAKKHGLVVEEKPEAKPDGEKPPAEPIKKEPVTPAERRAELKVLDEHPEKESEVLPKYSAAEQALYFERKRDKIKRQQAEIERDRVIIQKKAADERVVDLQRQLAAKATEHEDDPLDLDLEGTGRKPDAAADKPLTRGDLDRIDKEKAEKATEEKRELRARAEKLNASLTAQEAGAKARYQDFDQVIHLAEDILKNAATLYADDPAQGELVSLKVQQFITAAASADEFDDKDRTVADIGYELGCLHPKAKERGNANENGKQDTGEPLPREKINRFINNATKRVSSASMNGGGGRRVVSVDDITVEQASKLTLSEFRKLPRHVRDRLRSE